MITPFGILCSTGGTEEVHASSELAERVHHGAHLDPAEEGDGSLSQQEACPTS